MTRLPICLLLAAFASSPLPLRGAEPSKDAAPDSIAIVRRFADAMIEHGHENLPDPKLPLFPIVLTRDKYQVPRVKVSNLYTARVPQEFKSIANIHHDLNLYQIFYALTKITGEAQYAAEADRVIDYFLKHCQEPKYGFFCWGEHLGWDVLTNKPGGFELANVGGSMIHEFYRPWIYWDKSWEMAPDACHRFAQAVWRHQINHDGGTISFSRHAMIGKGDNPSRRGMDFPRHGGFYIATWGADYRHTKDPEILEAIDKLVAMYESYRNPKTGAIPHGSGDFAFDKDGRKTQYVYTQSPLGLAIELTGAAPAMPDALKARMTALAASIDKAFLATPHDPGPGGKGFVLFCDPATLAPTEYWQSKEELDAGKLPRRIPYTGGWRSAYTGQHPHTWVTPTLITRYQQTHNDGYKKLLVACADNYLTADPEEGLVAPEKSGRAPDVESGSIGNVIVLLNAVFKLTQDDKYLARAEWFSAWAAKKFWPDQSPLPRASVRENIYSAASRSDTLAMAMLQTALLRTQPDLEKELGLIATDR
ncbi:MAG: hypothetical protein R3F13_12600 [Prosthecobacter sp.]